MYKCRSCGATFSKPDEGIHEGVCPRCGHRYYDEVPKELRLTKTHVDQVLRAYYKAQSVMEQDGMTSDDYVLDDYISVTYDILRGKTYDEDSREEK